MPIPASVFIVDLDDTLTDTKKVKEILARNFQNVTGKDNASLLWETFENVKSSKGYADYKEISKIISKDLDIGTQKIEKIFYQSSFKDCLYPKAIEFIKYLQTFCKVIIFSHGDFEFQLHKIKTTGIEELVGKDNIFIFQNKKEKIREIVENFHNQGIYKISFIDDRADILDEAFLTDKTISCFWIRKGENESVLPNTSCISFHAQNIEEIYKFIYANNIIEKIDVPEQEDLQIKIGLNSNQISQLVTFTHQDKDVQKFTSDLERFQNKESFYKWVSSGKYIYSLLDSRENLLGIIWFSEKTPPEDNYSTKIDHYKITLGIRIYGAARGKGLGKKLFAVALRHFKSTTEYKSIKDNGFWSVISEENIPSKRLHESIGFKPVTKPNKEGKIVLIYE